MKAERATFYTTAGALPVGLGHRFPNPPRIFVLDDGMGLVAKRLEPIPIGATERPAPRAHSLRQPALQPL